MSQSHRREFLQEVSGGMLAVLVGSGLAAELGFAAEDNKDDKAKTAAGLARLSQLIQQTPTKDLLPALHTELKNGVTLKELIAAGALANARAFGGQDYNGYHSFMALCPSYAMAAGPARAGTPPAGPQGPLPHQHAHPRRPLRQRRPPRQGRAGQARRQESPRANRCAKPPAPASWPRPSRSSPRCHGTPEQTYDDMQLMIQDDLNVHRVVLAWRAWEVLDFIGKDHARDMLRQTVRFCSDPRHSSRRSTPSRPCCPDCSTRTSCSRPTPGSKKVDDAWVEKLARDGLLRPAGEGRRDGGGGAGGRGRSRRGQRGDLAGGDDAGAGRPGPARRSGRHRTSRRAASTATRSACTPATRPTAGGTSPRWPAPRNTFASLIAAAYHTAGQAGRQMSKPYPLAEDVEKVEAKDGDEADRGMLDEALRGKDQRRAAAVAARYGELGHDAKAIFAKLRQYAVSEDGALHAEKYFQTVSEEYGRSRAKFRWLHVIALARVTASAAGQPAPGVVEARKLLGL